jgi:D-alanyl-lipoteichoic acid acyltransferase DltB (MBOAT superfamily)
MLFNSLSFAVFLPIVFALYWLLQKRALQIQNVLLLGASYYFYACWDWRFLFLLMFSTLLDFYTGIRMKDAANDRNKKIWFWASIIINLGFLGVFKYYNFFAENLQLSLQSIGWHVDFWTLQVILPVGISFYTFHGLSYVVDIYYNRIEPSRNFVNYAVFVSFFPLLVAGPIERATHLLPQIEKKRIFNYSQAVDGLRQILWGLFKKVVIADNCAFYANMIFNDSADQSGSTLLVGAFFFTIQIYGDFSGYSDIALGTARLFGIELLRNFNYPYFSRDIAEFWRRWHISLSSWFKDYLYIPLGGSKGGKWMQVRNTFIIFIVSGFWHGANWTFIAWGFLNALYFLPLLLTNNNRNNISIVAENAALPNVKEVFQMGVTFFITMIAWVFFRSENISQALSICREIFSTSLFSMPSQRPLFMFLAIGFFFLLEWMGRRNRFALETLLLQKPRALRWGFYYVLMIAILLFAGKEQTFIYFQF